MATQISAKRREQLSKYATAAGYLYGAISVSEFVDVFNHYEAVKTNEQEVTLALKRLAQTDDVDFSLMGGLMSGPDFLLDDPEDMESARGVRAAQNGKPRYLPSRDEFLRYSEMNIWNLKNRIMN